MKTLWICLAILLIGAIAFAMTPINNDYKNPKDVYTELKNVFDNAQDKSFTSVVQSTPNYQDMRDGEMFVYIATPTAPVIKLMLRLGTTVYASPDFNIIIKR